MQYLLMLLLDWQCVFHVPFLRLFPNEASQGFVAVCTTLVVVAVVLVRVLRSEGVQALEQAVGGICMLLQHARAQV